MSQNRLFFLAGLIGATGVIFGAFGAHALRDTLLQFQTVSLWQTAVLYHLLHAVALLALAAGGEAGTTGRVRPSIAAAAVCWVVGTLLFSGSLYGLALGAPHALGPVTPVGGVLLLTGWVLVTIHGWRTSRNDGQHPTLSDH
jgi:uncharacterized membrane protein YgdD (TMEM256/DUF423 family)